QARAGFADEGIDKHLVESRGQQAGEARRRYCVVGSRYGWRIGSMQGDIRKSAKGGKTASLNVRIWYNPKTRHIHIALPNTVTTVNNDPTSERGHRNLFRKLARALKEAGVPGPDAD